MIRALAIATVLAPASTARADELPAAGPPNPVASRAAAEANLAPGAGRHDLVATAAVGTGIQVGLGVDDSTGAGGGVSLRVSQVASPRWLVGIELDLTVYAHRLAVEMAETKVNQSALLAAGGQFYPRDGVWVRGGLGLAAFSRRVQGSDARSRDYFGFGSVAGVGVELVKRRSLALELETFGTAAVYRDGVVVGGALCLGLVID